MAIYSIFLSGKFQGPRSLVGCIQSMGLQRDMTEHTHTPVDVQCYVNLVYSKVIQLYISVCLCVCVYIHIYILFCIFYYFYIFTTLLYSYYCDLSYDIAYSSSRGVWARDCMLCEGVS